MVKTGLLLSGLLSVTALSAAPIKTETIKRQLNLTMVLGKAELDQCAANMVRKAQTLTYTCELDIPQKTKNTKLQALLSPRSLEASYAGLRREVLVEVSNDARVLSLTTSFDVAGLDLELSKFNDDFYAVYGQAAHAVISDALRKQRIQLEVLESRR
jgi:hypothetical protein